MAGDGISLGDSFGFQAVAVQHVLKIGVAAEVELVSAVDAHAALLEKMGQRATEILGGWRTWLADNNATVMSVLLLVFAVVLIGQGISGLSG